MQRRRFIASSAAALGLTAARPALAAEPAQLSAAQRAPIEEAVAKAMTGSGTRGVSVTVARGGTIVYANGFGLRDVRSRAPVEAETVFPIGSITKQFTAAAIMLLVRDRRVALDAFAANYVPLAPHAAEYTVRQLLQQTSGLANYTTVPGFVTSIATSTTITPEGLAALVGRAPLAFKPGTQFEYSNTNYVILGMIVEAAARVPYARFIEERIAAPLGLAHLSFGPPSDGTNVARGYESQTGEAAVAPWSAQSTYAAGGLYAAPSDLVRWDDAFFGGKLLDASTVKLMTTPPQLPGDKKTEYAMGWIREALDGHPLIWHNGGVLGANTRNAYFPDQRISVIAFGNSVAFDETAIVREAFRALVPPTPSQLAAERERESTPAAGEDPAITAAARAEYERWREGKVDLTRYDATMRTALSEATMRQVSSGLAASGEPTALVFTGKTALPNGAGTAYSYRVVTRKGAFFYVYSLDRDGKIGGIWFKPAP
jgi:CubicO group peptidase (beta-lactamase class C family)